MKNFSPNTRFSELSNFTVGVFIKEISFDIGKEVLKFIKTELIKSKQSKEKYAYGIKELAKILECSNASV